MSTKGQEILSVFRYVQQVFMETQRILLKMDNLMGPEWKTVYGNRITKEVTSSLVDPERWLVEAVFRIYEAEDKLVNKGITISFWGEIEEPVITAGKLVYSDIKSRDHWDLWNSWFLWNPHEETKKALDGAVVKYKPDEDNNITDVQVFSLPLVILENDNDVESKIFRPLEKLKPSI